MSKKRTVSTLRCSKEDALAEEQGVVGLNATETFLILHRFPAPGGSGRVLSSPEEQVGASHSAFRVHQTKAVSR
jgi:hypothetical protein